MTSGKMTANRVEDLEQTVEDLKNALQLKERELKYRNAVSRLERDCRKHNIDARPLEWLQEELRELKNAN